MNVPVTDQCNGLPYLVILVCHVAFVESVVKVNNTDKVVVVVVVVGATVVVVVVGI